MVDRLEHSAVHSILTLILLCVYARARSYTPYARHARCRVELSLQIRFVSPIGGRSPGMSLFTSFGTSLMDSRHDRSTNRWIFIALSVRAATLCYTPNTIPAPALCSLSPLSLALSASHLRAEWFDFGMLVPLPRPSHAANDRPMRRRNKTSIRMIKVCRNTAS